MKYIGLICGGIPDTWEQIFRVEANNMKEAVDKVAKNLPYNSDIVEIKQED